MDVCTRPVVSLDLCVLMSTFRPIVADDRRVPHALAVYEGERLWPFPLISTLSLSFSLHPFSISVISLYHPVCELYSITQ